MLQDFRHAFRVWRRSPGSTSAALTALALGIGACTAIFSLIDAVVLRPLPYPNPERLVTVNPTERGYAVLNASWPMFRDWQRQSRVFERLAGYSNSSVNLTGGEPLRLKAAGVTPELFSVLGASPAAGTLNTNSQNVVLSYGFWMRRFGRDPAVLGRTLILDDKPYSLAGVLTPEFRFPRWSMMDEPDIYVPLEPNPNRLTPCLSVIGRLKPGITLAQARADMNTVSAAIERAYPDVNRGAGAAVGPLRDSLTFGAHGTLTAFTVAVVFVLLIACANAANLLLSQAVRRRREMAVRSALGASRARLMGQFLVESLALSACGGVLGIVLALWGMPLFMQAVPAHSVFNVRLAMGGLGLNRTILGFTAVLSVTAAVISGLVPAWRASRADAGARFLGSRGAQGEQIRGVLIAAEVALSLMLLAGTGMLLKSFYRTLNVDPGFNARGLLTIDIELPEKKYANVASRDRFVGSVLDRLADAPGVTAAAAVNAMPLTKESAYSSFSLPGSSREIGEVGFRAVTPGYFEAMGIPLVRGRFPTRGDAGIGVINQSMARRYWPHEDPIGKVLETPRPVRIQTPNGWDTRPVPEQFRVVGVVGDVRHLSLDAQPKPEMYLLYAQMATANFTFLLRGSVNPTMLSRTALNEVHAVDRDQPPAAVRTMDLLISQDVAHGRFILLLLAVFAAVAVSLAAAGIFAVISHSVSQRTREIGIRMALGANVSSVIRTVVRQTALWIGAGLLLGTAGALATGRLLNSYLFGVQPGDPVTLALAVAGLCAVSLAAAILPARGAARVDPATTLRCE